MFRKGHLFAFITSILDSFLVGWKFLFIFGQKSFHYLALLKTTIRHSMTSLKAADAKDVASSVSVIANEKLKAEKDAAGKKKTGMECASSLISITIYVDMKNMKYAHLVRILWLAWQYMMI